MAGVMLTRTANHAAQKAPTAPIADTAAETDEASSGGDFQAIFLYLQSLCAQANPALEIGAKGHNRQLSMLFTLPITSALADCTTFKGPIR